MTNNEEDEIDDEDVDIRYIKHLAQDLPLYYKRFYKYRNYLRPNSLRMRRFESGNEREFVIVSFEAININTEENDL